MDCHVKPLLKRGCGHVCGRPRAPWGVKGAAKHAASCDGNWAESGCGGTVALRVTPVVGAERVLRALDAAGGAAARTVARAPTGGDGAAAASEALSALLIFLVCGGWHLLLAAAQRWVSMRPPGVLPWLGGAAAQRFGAFEARPAGFLPLAVLNAPPRAVAAPLRCWVVPARLAACGEEAPTGMLLCRIGLVCASESVGRVGGCSR